MSVNDGFEAEQERLRVESERRAAEEYAANRVMRAAESEAPVIVREAVALAKSRGLKARTEGVFSRKRYFTLGDIRIFEDGTIKTTSALNGKSVRINYSHGASNSGGGSYALGLNGDGQVILKSRGVAYGEPLARELGRRIARS